MDESRISKKISNGDFYIIAFLLTFTLLYGLLGPFFRLIISLLFSLKNPGFFKTFQNLEKIPIAEYTDSIWATNNIASFLASLIILILIIVFLGKNILRDFKIFKKDIKHHLGGIVFGFIVLVIINTLFTRLYTLFGIEGTSDNQESILLALKSNTAFLIYLSVVLLAPVVEEVIFRKCIHGIVEEKFNLAKIFSVLISSVIFASMHAIDVFFFSYLAMAIVLGLSYTLFKNNIIVPIGIHFLNNATILINILMILRR